MTNGESEKLAVRIKMSKFERLRTKMTKTKNKYKKDEICQTLIINGAEKLLHLSRENGKSYSYIASKAKA